MGLSVIGAGFGRTGTLSLKGALEQLGFGPCHHMAEVFDHPEQIPLWQQAAAGAAVNWDKLLAGYRSTVDWPSAYFWRELAETYPEAKVLLSTRDVDAWYASFSNTILKLIAAKDEISLPPVRAALEMGAPWSAPRSSGTAPTTRIMPRLCSGRTRRRCAGPSRRKDCWSSKSVKAGSRSAPFSACRFPTAPSRASTTPSSSRR